MTKFTQEELLDIVPTSIKNKKDLTKKQLMLLGQFIMYDGLDHTKENGFFYRSNKDLCTDIDANEKTIISGVRKLELLGYITRKKGKRGVGASEYQVSPIAKNYSENYSNNYSENYSNNYSDSSINYSTDTESDKDIEIDKDNIYNNINKKNNIPDNIIEIFEKLENMNKLVRELKQRVSELEKENKQLSSILESKDNKNSSIINNNSLQLKKETNTKLEEENSNSTPTVTAAKVESKKESTKGKSINEKIDILLQRMESINSLEEFSHKLHQAEEWFIKQGFHTSQREAEPEVVYFIANSQKIYNKLSSIEEEKKKELEEIEKQSFPICASEDELIRSLTRGHQRLSESVSYPNGTDIPTDTENATSKAIGASKEFTVMDYSEWLEPAEEILPF